MHRRRNFEEPVMAHRTPPAEWPTLPYDEWAATRKTLHLYTQIAGNVRLGLCPPALECVRAPLLLTARGLSTGPMAWGTASVELGFDFLNHRLAVVASDGWSRLIPLTPARTVADLYADVARALDDLGVAVDISPEPQGVADTTPLDRNHHDSSYDPAAVRRWFRSLTAAANVLDRWRSGYFGRTGLDFWWATFDLSVVRYTGARVTPAADADRLLRQDRDAEHFSAGWWPGDDAFPEPAFYAYAYPMPAGAHDAVLSPEGAGWDPDGGRWILRYEDARATGDIRQAVLEFLDSTWTAACEAAGWDRAQAIQTR
jgi:hypothetical protein